MKRRLNRSTLVPLLIAAAGIVFIVTGILRGEADDVFTKAVNICLECVGIG